MLHPTTQNDHLEKIMSANSARSIRPVCELPDDYEIVILADGTKVKRERQTKAQARIQALKIKKRNEQLRQTLNALSLAAGESLKITDTVIKGQDKDLIDQQINQIKNALLQNQKKSVVKHVEQDSHKDDCSIKTHDHGISAIEKQLIANSEVKAQLSEITKQTEVKPNKSPEFKISKLKKLFFGKLIY